jgi:hypothetical protein
VKSLPTLDKAFEHAATAIPGMFEPVSMPYQPPGVAFASTDDQAVIVWLSLYYAPPGTPLRQARHAIFVRVGGWGGSDTARFNDPADAFMFAGCMVDRRRREATRSNHEPM